MYTQFKVEYWTRYLMTHPTAMVCQLLFYLIDEASPRCHRDVKDYRDVKDFLDNRLPASWIGA